MTSLSQFAFSNKLLNYSLSILLMLSFIFHRLSKSFVSYLTYKCFSLVWICRNFVLNNWKIFISSRISCLSRIFALLCARKCCDIKYLSWFFLLEYDSREVARAKLVKRTEWKVGYPKIACGSNLITIENGLIYIILIYQFVCFLLSVERIFTIRLAVPSIAYKLY